MTMPDNNLLLVLIIIPLFSAIFVSRIPHFDMSSVRQITIAVLMVWLAFLLKCGHILFLSKEKLAWRLNYTIWLDENVLDLFLGQIQFVLLLALWCALFTLFILNKRITENNGLSFSVIILLMQALATLGILSSTLAISIVTANLGLYLFLFLVASHGGPEKGTAVLVSSLFFLTVDIFSLAVFFLPTTIWLSVGYYLYWIALAPALARLLNPFFSPFSRTLFENSSIAIKILYVAFIIPTGAALLFSIKNTLYLYHPAAISSHVVTILVFASSFFSALWIISEKDCRQIGLSLLIFYNAIFINFVLEPHHGDLSRLAILIIFCAIICASFTLYVGQLLFWEQGLELSDTRINHLWLASLALWLPLPGLGIGTALWIGYVDLFSSTLLSPMFNISFCFILFLLLITALIQNYFRQIDPQKIGKSPLSLRPRTLGSLQNAWATFAAVLFLCLFSSTYFFNTGD